MNKPHRASRGQALVEFALVLPFMVLLLMGMFDLGRGVYAYNVVSSAAREGARYAIVRPLKTDEIRTQAFAGTPGIGPLTMDAPVCTDANGVSGACTVFNAIGGNTVTITVHYTFQPVTMFFATVNLTGKSTMTIE